ncbi:MAG TPA: MEDS domain-containing protein [Candidatus Acidoferrales bacterium]|nr:MEDS domain-containing protein [Candidatus Acidoferrales bacterium]
MSASDFFRENAEAPVARGTIFEPNTAHIVHFYREDDFLLNELTSFIGGSLAKGDAAVILATGDHIKSLTHNLRTRGLDIAKLTAQGRYLPLRASDILPQIMVNGALDASRFSQIAGELIARANAAAKGEPRRTVVFGELVAMLWAEGNCESAIRLEELWNRLAETHSFFLRCAYPIAGFSKNEHAESFLKICAAHSSVIPQENYSSLLDDEERRRNVAALRQRLEILEDQKAAYENELQLRLFIDAVQDYAIFMLDPGGYIRTWNRGAQRLKGYQASEILGQHFSRFYSEEDIRDGKPARELEIATRDGRVEDEGWRLRKDGSKFWANVVITALKDDTGKLVGFGKVTRDFTESMLAQRTIEESRQQLQESEKSLRQLSRHLLRSQDEQRRRIGRDLHDSLGQYLSVLKMKLESLAGRLGENAPPDDLKDLKQCIGLTEDAVKEVRTISYLLYPPMLEEMGLRSAILWYLDGFMKRSGIQTTFEVSPQFQRLPSDTELALFRVLQESLTNVHRHSGSPTARTRLWVEGEVAVLEIGDVGRGMNVQKGGEFGKGGTATIGVGLRGMTERIRELGGTLELASSSEGTIVRATVPIAAPEGTETAASRAFEPDPK